MAWIFALALANLAFGAYNFVSGLRIDADLKNDARRLTNLERHIDRLQRQSVDSTKDSEE